MDLAEILLPQTSRSLSVVPSASYPMPKGTWIQCENNFFILFMCPFGMCRYAKPKTQAQWSPKMGVGGGGGKVGVAAGGC